MNLLRIIGSMDPISGGPCQGIRNVVPELRKLNINNEVVSLDDTVSPFSGEDKFTIHALGHKGRWYYSPNLIPWLNNNIYRFDAIIVHGLWLYHGYAVNKVVNSLKKLNGSAQKIPKVFVMPHGMLDPYLQKVFHKKWKAIRNYLYWKVIQSAVINRADGVLFTCEEELKLAGQSFKPYRPNAEYNIGYGVAEPPPFAPEMRGAFSQACPGLSDRPFLLFLSRIHEKKGVDLLLQAYKEVCGKVADSQGLKMPALVIAGPGLEKKYGKKIQQMAAEMGIGDAVFFPGVLSGDAKWGAFYRCDGFILPSHQENFGIAVAEALSCGKPVLISNRVNIWREIESMNAGIVCKDTVQDFCNSLFKWIRLTLEEKEQMNTNARMAFIKYFHIISAAMKLKKTIGETAD